MLFTDEQIRYMKHELGLLLNYNDLSVDALDEIDEVVGERLKQCRFDEKYKLTSEGEMCKSIIDSVPLIRTV